MINRVLDICERPARLSIRNSLLVIESDGAERAAIPCSELAAVVIGHRQVTLTQSVLTELARAGALVVTCDEKFAPASMVLLWPKYSSWT
jgi:CRISPR-associated protein Cas1